MRLIGDLLHHLELRTVSARHDLGPWVALEVKQNRLDLETLLEHQMRRIPALELTWRDSSCPSWEFWICPFLGSSLQIWLFLVTDSLSFSRNRII